jgi:uncharacterized protein (DUF488 family)
MAIPQTPAPPAEAIFTAGFADLSLEKFILNLRAFDIRLLADVRPPAFSGTPEQFVPQRIGPAALAAGMDYRNMGQRLGGVPVDPRLYDIEGHVRYDLLAREPSFLEGIDALLHELRQGRRIALVCREEDPRGCHRRQLIGRVLRREGVGVAHILTDGSVVSEAELRDAEPASAGGPWLSAYRYQHARQA